jgi:hypothetical protein
MFCLDHVGYVLMRSQSCGLQACDHLYDNAMPQIQAAAQGNVCQVTAASVSAVCWFSGACAPCELLYALLVAASSLTLQ